MIETNFRITKNYVFEIFSPERNAYFQCWIEGAEGAATLEIFDTPSAEETLDEDFSILPAGNENSNYRVIADNVLQLFNITTAKWHTVYFSGANPTFTINQEGEI